MTKELILEVVKAYKEVLGSHHPVRIENKTWFPNFAVGGDRRMVGNHMAWMVREIESFVAAGKIEKANRWLGFLQCGLWALGIHHIEQMRTHNRGEDPDEE